MPALRFASLMAGNHDSFFEGLTVYLARRLGREAAFLDAQRWEERQRMLLRGEAELGVVCGLHYVAEEDAGGRSLELLAAPVRAEERYRDRPVYYSDVIVAAASPYQSFEDLRGRSFAYNEPTSHSGHNVVCHHLAGLGEDRHYFGRTVEAGSHQIAVLLVRDCFVDGAAIDSTVLATELAHRPDLHRKVRVVASLGPSPAPPLVVHRGVPEETRAALREALASMHEDPEGGELLAAEGVARMARVEDADYAPVREMARTARRVTLSPFPPRSLVGDG